VTEANCLSIVLGSFKDGVEGICINLLQRSVALDSQVLYDAKNIIS